MTLNQAQVTLVQLYNNNPFWRGYLHAREAWVGSIPDKEKNPTEHANLVQIFKDIAEALENQPKP